MPSMVSYEMYDQPLVHETLGIRSPMTATHWAEFLPAWPSISH